MSLQINVIDLVCIISIRNDYTNYNLKGKRKTHGYAV